MATNKAASMETMQELHSLIVQTHINRLKKDIEEGFITDAATASAIAKLLADNGVFCAPADKEDLADLRDELKQNLEMRRQKRKALQLVKDAEKDFKVG